MLLHYLVKVEKPKMRVNTTSAFNVNYKIAVTCIKLLYIDGFIKRSGESYKWTFMSEHAFKVSITSMHRWSQMVTPALMTFQSKSKQVCIKHFCRSSMWWIFVSCTLCC